MTKQRLLAIDAQLIYENYRLTKVIEAAANILEFKGHRSSAQAIRSQLDARHTNQDDGETKLTA